MMKDKAPAFEAYTFDELHNVLGHIERGTYSHEMVLRLAHTALSVMESWYTVSLGSGEFVIRPDGSTLRCETLKEAMGLAQRFTSVARSNGSDYVLIYKGDNIVDKVAV